MSPKSSSSHRESLARDATPHHRPLPIEGRPQPTCLRSVARTARKPPRPARRSPLTAMPAAPAVYCSAARASQLRLRVAPGSGQPAAPSALRGGRTLRLRCLSLAALRITVRIAHNRTGYDEASPSATRSIQAVAGFGSKLGCKPPESRLPRPSHRLRIQANSTDCSSQ